MNLRVKLIQIIATYSEKESTVNYLLENDDLSQLGIDSISFINMVVEIENEFGIEFEDSALDFNKFTSLNSLCAYIENLKKCDLRSKRMEKLLRGRSYYGM